MADSERVFNERKQVKSDLRELMGYLSPIVIAIVLVTVLNKFVLINARIPSGSMENTIQIGDRIVGFRLAYKNAAPQRGEIIMFEHPDHPDDPDNILIKRVIGLPGENVRIEDVSQNICYAIFKQDTGQYNVNVTLFGIFMFVRL